MRLQDFKRAIVHLKKPVGFGNKNVIDGYVDDRPGAGIYAYEKASGRGMTQFIPLHLVEKIEHIEEEKKAS